jgi:hypothetical protein
MKKFTIALFLVIMIGALIVSAQENPQRATVEKLLLLMGMDNEQTIDQMFHQITQIPKQQLYMMNIPQDQFPRMEHDLDKVFHLLKTEMTWNRMKDDFIDLYLSVYTEEEIEHLIAFYESPLGQTVVEKTPLLVQQSMSISQKYVQRILPTIQAMTQEMLEAQTNFSDTPVPELQEDGSVKPQEAEYNTALPILERAVWNFDWPLIENILELLLTVNPSLMYVDVQGEYGEEIWCAKFRAGYDDYFSKVNTPMKDMMHIHILPITSTSDTHERSEKIGILRLVFSSG